MYSKFDEFGRTHVSGNEGVKMHNFISSFLEISNLLFIWQYNFELLALCNDNKTQFDLPYLKLTIFKIFTIKTKYIVLPNKNQSVKILSWPIYYTTIKWTVTEKDLSYKQQRNDD